MTQSIAPGQRRWPALPLRTSLRTRLLLVVFGGAILPLALLGLWLARSAQRSGEVLLTSRLDDALGRVIQEMVPRWMRVRSDLLEVAESQAVLELLGPGTIRRATDSTIHLESTPRGPSRARPMWIVDGAGTRTRVVWGGYAAGNFPAPALLVRLPIHHPRTGERMATMETHVATDELIPPGVGGAAGVGSIVAAFDPGTGASLLPLPFEPSLMSSGRFAWEQEQWLARFRSIPEPAVVLGLAAPLTPYTEPFQRLARDGAFALAIVSVLGFLVVALLTRRLTGTLAELAGAAHAVARGDLDQRVREVADDEVGSVARAFNRMTRDLRQTLDQLARQQGLASVGEFAASMAHEVRNPLTAIRIGLQNLDEDVTEPAHRDALEQMLRQVQRLDATVSGSLRVARGGQMSLQPVDVRAALQSACNSARPEFDARQATLVPLDEGAPPILLRADPAALEQLFLNLLLNAAQALNAGGIATVDVRQSGAQVEIRISDTGHGIDAERLAAVFEPLVSTRPGGTGLGLTIAQRIAQAHGGRVELESTKDAGTTALVMLPCIPTNDRLTIE